MKRLISWFLVAALSCVAHAAPIVINGPIVAQAAGGGALTLVQRKVSNYSNTTSVSAVFTSASTNGSLIVATLSIEGDATSVSTIGDGTNGSYGSADISTTKATSGNGTGGTAAIYHIKNTGTATLTVSVTLSGSASYGVLSVYEFTGQHATTPLDSTQGASGEQTLHTLTITTVANNCAIVTIGTAYPSAASPDTGFTEAFAEIGLSNSYHYGEYDDNVGTGGGKTLTENRGSPTIFVFSAAAYKGL